jgi:hypothetical protein
MGWSWEGERKSLKMENSANKGLFFAESSFRWLGGG